MTTIADVRELQEAAKDKWSTVVREAIIQALRRGSFYADDLEQLGIPKQHRNIVGSQTGYLVSKRYMQEVGRRKSTVPSRKGAKSGVYEFTRTGREKLAGVSVGVLSSQEAGRVADPGWSASADSGERSPEEMTGASGEPVRLFGDEPSAPKAPSAYDPWSDAA